jgi:uncharacterized protein
MKVVLDTNVLVAGLVSPFGPCGDMVRMVSAGKLTLCVDARVLSEYHEVLRRPKFNFDQDRVAAILDYIEHHSLVVASVPLSVSLPDPDDEPFLEIASSGGASYLVTGNNAHFPSQLCEGVKVVSPAGFLRHVVKPRNKKSR